VYIELKLHIHILETSETYFTSCEKGHNTGPLKTGFMMQSLGLMPSFVFIRDQFTHTHTHVKLYPVKLHSSQTRNQADFWGRKKSS